MDEACKEAKLFVTATGCKNIIRANHFKQVHISLGIREQGKH